MTEKIPNILNSLIKSIQAEKSGSEQMKIKSNKKNEKQRNREDILEIKERVRKENVEAVNNTIENESDAKAVLSNLKGTILNNIDKSVAAQSSLNGKNVLNILES